MADRSKIFAPVKGTPVALLAVLFLSQTQVADDLHRLNFHGANAAARGCSAHRHISLKAGRTEGMDHSVCLSRHVTASTFFATGAGRGPKLRPDHRIHAARSRRLIPFPTFYRYSPRAPPPPAAHRPLIARPI